MTYDQAEQLYRKLERSPIELSTEPRGFGHDRGVPDSVIWARPTRISVHRVLPILVELEGNLSNVDDFEKFARRTSDKEPYQHHVDIPIVDADADPCSVKLPYDVFAVGGRLLVDQAELTEPVFHDALRSWIADYGHSFETEARITVRGDTRLVWWRVRFTMFGHTFNTQLPFIVDAGENLVEILRLQASRIIIPSLAVIDRNADRRHQGISWYETDIHFTRFSSTQFARRQSQHSF